MKIFIGCASSNKIPEKYKEDCKKYLENIFKENNDLVFGADNKGLMGLSYKTALNFKRSITGICPEAYIDDFKNLNCNAEIIAKNVAGRTEKLIKTSDALVFLPGGIGTIYELFTAIESKRSHEHDKPIVIYNSNNYFDELIDLLEKMYEENFAIKIEDTLYHISESSKDTLNYINNYYNNNKKTKQKVK